MNGFARLGPAAPWLALAVLLGVGLPIFLCMPLWADATLYDLAARNVAEGGVAYRDVFDTNLPGMVWLHLLVRSLLGDRPEALRLADVVVYSGVVALLLLWLRRLGGSAHACAWTAVALYAFYFSLSELCHCQRDTWMLLPALGALALRQRRLDAAAQGEKPAEALLEGALWATAFWIKPFVAVPALACWLVNGAVERRWAGAMLRDTLTVVAGGAAVGAAGLAWLVHSGAWPHVQDVFLHWNPEYLTTSDGWERRTRFLCKAFVPWSLVHLVAAPLAALTLARALLHSSAARAWALPSAFYLGWLFQAAYLQKGYEYTLASALPPALVLVAGRAWWPGPLRLGTAVLVAFGLLAAWRHPLLRSERLAVWERCLREGSSPEVRDRLKLVTDRNGTDWTDLRRVADHLRLRGAGDGEVTCYNNSTHPLYVTLGLRPSTRYLHFDTLLMCFPSRREEMRRALAESGQKYVVSDLRAVPLTPEEVGGGAALPEAFPDDLTQAFPWSLPVRFRAGRYLVHDVGGDVGPLVSR